MTRVAVALVVVALLAVLAWNAGEMHRQNCIRDGRTACSVLPWDSGKHRGEDFSDLYDNSNSISGTPSVEDMLGTP